MKQQQGYGMIGSLVSLIFGIILSIVTLRLLFILLDANSVNSFVSWIYSVSEPLVAPFSGVFQNLNLFDGRLEIQSLVALVVYGLVASVLGTALGIGSHRTHSV